MLFKNANADKNQKRKIHVNGAGMITLLNRNRFHFHEKYRMEKKASGRNAIRNKLSELNSPA